MKLEIVKKIKQQKMNCLRNVLWVEATISIIYLMLKWGPGNEMERGRPRSKWMQEMKQATGIDPRRWMDKEGIIWNCVLSVEVFIQLEVAINFHISNRMLHLGLFSWIVRLILERFVWGYPIPKTNRYWNIHNVIFEFWVNIEAIEIKFFLIDYINVHSISLPPLTSWNIMKSIYVCTLSFV